MDDKTSLIRTIQIDLITNKPNQVIQWFDQLWTNISLTFDGDLNIYYNSNNEWLLCHNAITNAYNYNMVILWSEFPYRYYFGHPFNYYQLIIMLIFEYKLNIFSKPVFNPVEIDSGQVQGKLKSILNDF